MNKHKQYFEMHIIHAVFLTQKTAFILYASNWDASNWNASNWPAEIGLPDLPGAYSEYRLFQTKPTKKINIMEQQQ